MTQIRKKYLKMIYSAINLSLCLVLPMFTGNIPVVGETLSPMHFPVLLCGFTAGPYWGGIIGFVAPCLRNLIFGMPSPFYPKALRMAFELAGYGFFAGFFHKYLPKKIYSVYISLIASMCLGRVIYGVTWFFMTLFDKSFDFYIEFVITHTITSTAFGMIFQVLLIPPVVLALEKAKLM